MANVQFTMQLEVIGDAESPADAATLGDIATGVVTELRKEHYIVNPVYTGQKGGPELFAIIGQAVEQGTTFALHHPAQIATYVSAISTIITKVKDVKEKFTAKHKIAVTTKITLTNMKSGISTTIEGDDPETLARLAQELVAESGQLKATAHVQQPRKHRRR